MKIVIFQELQKHGSPDIVMALVGNKADLHENRVVSVEVCHHIPMPLFISIIISLICCL